MKADAVAMELHQEMPITNNLEEQNFHLRPRIQPPRYLAAHMLKSPMTTILTKPTSVVTTTMAGGYSPTHTGAIIITKKWI